MRLAQRDGFLQRPQDAADEILIDQIAAESGKAIEFGLVAFVGPKRIVAANRQVDADLIFTKITRSDLVRVGA